MILIFKPDTTLMFDYQRKQMTHCVKVGESICSICGPDVATYISYHAVLSNISGDIGIELTN